MAGILATSACIMLILGFAFWYLIRTLLRQRTLEEMKDDFTNNITHELKTPIAVAYAANDALLNFGKDADEEKRKRYLRHLPGATGPPGRTGGTDTRHVDGAAQDLHFAPHDLPPWAT